VTFPNPLFTASGTWGYGVEFLDLVDPAALGGVVTKTITVRPRKGNPQPRVRELPTGMLNSIGLENVGLDAFVAEKLPTLAAAGVRTIVSLAGRREEEFAEMVERLAEHAGWVGVELNLSCPNVAEGGLDFGTDPSSIARITERARRALPDDRCLLVKLTPNNAPIAELARAAAGAGADAVTCINTLVGMAVDLHRRAPVFTRGTAGYSGPGIKPVALAKVYEAARSVSIPVVGVGGIATVEDVLEFLVVGATAVQVGTMLFPRPDLACRLVDELAKALAARGATDCAAMRCDLLRPSSSAEASPCPDPGPGSS
jgi:dihydroorotate dehydrogenase (NAD+) catalytic subunit